MEITNKKIIAPTPIPLRNIEADNFDSTWKKQLEYLLSVGKSAGADLIEIFLEKTDYLGVLAEQDAITSVNPSFGKGAGIRIFKNKRDGFISTNDLSNSGLYSALEQALNMLGLSSIIKNNSQLVDLEILRDYSDCKQNWLSKSPGMKHISQKLLEGTNALDKINNHIDVKRASYSRGWQEVIIANSDGTFARDIRLHQSIGLSAIATDKEHRSSIGRRYGSSSLPSDIDQWDYEESASEISESLNNMLYANYVEAGQMPAILANKFGGVIFHEACGHLLETTQIERGTTPFADKINQKIANESVTAVDEGSTDSAFGSVTIDDEGMESQKVVLIENGILKNFISDRAGEMRTGHQRTGSARRQSHTFAAASRMRNTYIEAGKYEPSELISSVENGIYCKSMGGGSVGPTGQFNFSVEEGYIIKNGKLTKPVKGATLIGEAKQIMPRISMCANDLKLAAGFCGSVSGTVNVTVGQPHIKVDSITVGGR